MQRCTSPVCRACPRWVACLHCGSKGWNPGPAPRHPPRPSFLSSLSLVLCCPLGSALAAAMGKATNPNPRPHAAPPLPSPSSLLLSCGAGSALVAAMAETLWVAGDRRKAALALIDPTVAASLQSVRTGLSREDEDVKRGFRKDQDFRGGCRLRKGCLVVCCASATSPPPLLLPASSR